MRRGILAHPLSFPRLRSFCCGSSGLRDFLWRQLKHTVLCFQLFSFKLPAISSDSAPRNFIHSFAVEWPLGPAAHPSWDLDVVLRHLSSSAYEPLQSQSLRTIIKKVLFLVSLATARRVRELQAFSRVLPHFGDDLILSYLPSFVAKTVAL